MRGMLGLLAASALVGLASTASADEITGPIQQIDRISNTFVLHGTQFVASPQNTVGVKLADPEAGRPGHGLLRGQPILPATLERHGAENARLVPAA
jgi:hypothetical protein